MGEKLQHVKSYTRRKPKERKPKKKDSPLNRVVNAEAEKIIKRGR